MLKFIRNVLIVATGGVVAFFAIVIILIMMQETPQQKRSREARCSTVGMSVRIHLLDPEKHPLTPELINEAYGCGYNPHTGEGLDGYGDD